MLGPIKVYLGLEAGVLLYLVDEVAQVHVALVQSNLHSKINLIISRFYGKLSLGLSFFLFLTLVNMFLVRQVGFYYEAKN